MMKGDRPGLQGYDEEQVRMMKEDCIVVDDNDNIIGSDSKVNCHIGEGKLHRAFSVLLFNSSGKLLIQKRAANKITFPSIWANSCCSHPLYTDKEIDGIKLLGFDNLTFVPIDKRLMDLSILTKLEKDWINNYHMEVLKKIGIFLEGSALEWLHNASKPI